MSITVGDNFNYQGAKPLDSRMQFTSVANMKAYPDASLYDGCIAYVTNIKKNYQYDSSNTVDTTTGKWREFETGGGGGSIPAGGTTGQALLKASNADEDVTWGNPVDANAFHSDEAISDIVDDVSYFPYMYTAGQSFYKYRMSWGNVKSKLKTYFDQYYSGGGTGGITIDATLTAANWNSTTKQQTVTFTGYTSSMGGVIGMPTSATATQKTAYENAKINVVSVSGTSFTFECTTIPSVDLPVTLYAGGGSGGTGGTTDYTDLTNKPQIAGVTLTGNQAVASFGLTSEVLDSSSGGSAKSYVTTGEKYTWETCGTVFGNCTTSASTTNKVVGVERGSFNFERGARISVVFWYTNTASSPTLTVNNTTKNIKCIDENGSAYTPVIWWNANDIVEFVYDGTQFLMQPTMQMLFSGQGTKIPREQIYSTSEKVVGCWTDGRPIYQKTFSGYFASTTQGVWGDTNIGTISNFKDSIAIEGWYVPSGATYVVLPWTTNAGYIAKCRIDKSGTTGTVMLCTNNSNMNTNVGYVTVRYTKSTDAANSFNYGDPNEYSTTEKIVGTWIDGKTLYQKTINFGALPNTTQKLVSMGLSNVSVKSLKGYADDGAFTINLPHTGVGTTAATSSIALYRDGTYIGVTTGQDRTNFTTCYVTIQYTKS